MLYLVRKCFLSKGSPPKHGGDQPGSLLPDNLNLSSTSSFYVSAQRDRGLGSTPAPLRLANNFKPRCKKGNSHTAANTVLAGIANTTACFLCTPCGSGSPTCCTRQAISAWIAEKLPTGFATVFSSKNAQESICIDLLGGVRIAEISVPSDNCCGTAGSGLQCLVAASAVTNERGSAGCLIRWPRPSH